MVETVVVVRQSERMSNLVGYLRKPAKASTLLGLAGQRKAIQRWAGANGHEVATWCQDEASAADDNLDRPGYRQAVDVIEAGRASGVVVSWVGQFGRMIHIQQAAMIVLWEGGAEVHSATQGGLIDRNDDPALQIARATVEAVVKFDRVHRTGNSKPAGRRRAGASPYGYVARDGALVADDAEQAVLTRIGGLRAAGGSYGAVADALNASGITTKRGGRWTAQQVHATVNGRAGRRPRPAG